MRRWAAAGATILACALSAAPAAAQVLAPAAREVHVVRVTGWTLERFLADPTLAGLAAAGGAVLLPGPGALGAAAEGGEPGARVRELLGATEAERVLVVVASVSDPGGTRLVPVVLAEGAPADLLGASGPPRSLRSDATHRIGVATADDLAAAIGSFRDGGSAFDAGLAVVDDAPPVALERRFRERAATELPLEGTVALLVTAVALLSLVLLARGRGPRRLLDALAWSALAVPGLALSLLLVGHLPSLVLAVVAPAVAVGTAAVIGIGTRAGDRAPSRIGWIVLGGLAVEAATGWDGAVLPLLGGSQLDGARFYGLPNAFIGLLVGAALYAAWRLPRGTGTALVAATAVVAGFPGLGSNFGGAITASFAAGAWWAVRGDDGVSPRALMTGLGAAVVGAVVVALAHAVWPEPTHITAAVRGGDLLGTYLHRLGIALRILREQPLTFIPALGAPVLLGVALRPPAALRRGFAAAQGAREVVVVAAAAGVIAFLVNDSGASAAGLAFGLGLALALWASLRATADGPA